MAKATSSTGKAVSATRKPGASVRAIGRPGSAEAGVGKDALITATCELLMHTQPSQVTRALVARHTGVDPSLIRYYFHDRSSLLVAAAERITLEYSSALQQAVANSGNQPESLLRARVATLVELEAKYPFFHQLFIEEVLNSDAPAAKAMTAGLTERASSAYGSILRQGIAQGDFRDLDADLLFVSIIGMCEFFTSAVKLLGVIAGRPVSLDEVKDRYKSFICDLIIHGIEGRASAPAQAPSGRRRAAKTAAASSKAS